jgi:hypothetical protein
MKLVIAQSFRRELIHRWRWDAAAKRTELSEAHVIDKNQ